MVWLVTPVLCYVNCDGNKILDAASAALTLNHGKCSLPAVTGSTGPGISDQPVVGAVCHTAFLREYLTDFDSSTTDSLN